MSKKRIALLMAVVMVLGVAVGSTMAWLTDKTGDVTNTFTVGDINIDLKEHDYDPATKTLKTPESYTENLVTSESDYLFVPGDKLPKDPFVTVKANSEPCWVFVKVAETYNNITENTTVNGNTFIHADDIIEWNIDTANWTPVNGVENVWYKEITAKSATDTYLNVLNEKQITVSEDVTKPMVDYINGNDKLEPKVDAHKPVLTFTAYAIQSANLKDNAGTAINSAEEAWKLTPGYEAPTNP